MKSILPPVLAILLVGTLLIRTLFADDLSRTSDYEYEAPVAGSYTLPVIKHAADGEVLDSKGQPLHLRDVTRDRVTVMSFIYTRCAAAKACPYATGVLRQLHQLSSEDPALAKGMRLTAKEHNLEMYAAFDESFENIQLQMARRHDRVKDHKGRRYGVKGKTKPVVEE